MMADAEATGVVAAIASSLTIIATVIQGLYANRKGKRREPKMDDMHTTIKQVAADVKDVKRDVAEVKHDVGVLDARVERVERNQDKKHQQLDDTEERKKP